MMDYEGDPHEVIRGRMRITKAFINGRDVVFVHTHFRDLIQREHMSGRFYEPEELEIIRRHFKPGDVFCDMGSNIGNHAMFVGLFLRPSKIICFEPNPEVIRTLKANIFLNNLEQVCDLSLLGLGLGAQDAEDFGIKFGSNNTGGGRMIQGDGELPIRTADSVLAGAQIDFAKVDVEGMELQVLAGMRNIMETQRPKVFVEVANGNIDAVNSYFDGYGYTRAEEFRRYPKNINFLFLPDSAAS